MKISILTLFPEMFTPLEGSIIGRARNSGKIEIQTVNIRDYSLDKHHKCDDAPFGGGAGMLMTPQPIADCITAIDPDHKAKRIFLSPKGKVLTQTKVKELASGGDLLLLCGHYEGVDQRVIDLFIDEEVSIGDYVLTGGELPAMVLTDAVCRYVDGVISSDSLTAESFSDNLLEYPQYTRPQVFMGLEVPEVLLNGNHKLINEWRREQSIKLTKKLRPDIIKDNPDL
jgi:tRNA (guanine37-N1)-methyltransferase